jgi:MtN3 and saliva related transmembrane protein
MSIYVAALGWVATLVGLARMYPQARTLARSRSATGVSSWSIALTVLSMIWWLIYCVAIADIPSSVSSLGSAIAPIACLVLLSRHGMVRVQHVAVIVLGALVGFVGLFLGVSVIGAMAAASTMAYAIPQFLRLVRTRDVAGLSESSWALTAFNTALWTLYGFYIQSIPLMLPALVTIPIAIAVAVSMERYGACASSDGVLIGRRRRSFTFNTES